MIEKIAQLPTKTKKQEVLPAAKPNKKAGKITKF
jgi:hypothetical protein